MTKISSCCNWITLQSIPTHPGFNLSAPKSGEQQRWRKSTVCAAKSGGWSPKSTRGRVKDFLGVRHNIVWRILDDVGVKRIDIPQVIKRCQTCGGKGAIECPGCKIRNDSIHCTIPSSEQDAIEGTGKNKKNGNIFERWKCFDCQGFGLQSCPRCGQGGLTPEQRGER